MVGKRQYTALEWIIREIKVSLQEAQRALETYSGNFHDTSPLRSCRTLMHRVSGSLRMVGFHGAAMLAEETEALAQALLDGKLRDSQIPGHQEALDVLLSGIVQLPDYLERVRLSRQDYPALVLSLLNDMRSVRGASLLSEATLFAPNLDYARRIRGTPHPICQDSPQLQMLVGKLRQLYQYAAACIFHQINVEENLLYLQKTSDRLHKLLHGTRHKAIWEIADAVIGGLHKKIISPSAALKNLLRDLDGELRQIEVMGSAALAVYPSDELLKNLLYYIGTSATQSAAMAAIRKRYHLNQIPPLIRSASDQAGAAAVDITTMRAVSAAVKEECSVVKSLLNQCLNNEGEQKQHLDLMQTVLQRVSDTLAMLGIGEPRQSVDNLLTATRAARVQETVVTQAPLLEMLQSLTKIELRLDRALFSTRLPGGNTHSLDEAQTALLQTCRNGLETAKDAIVAYVACDWDTNAIKPAPGIMGKVRDHLSALSLTRASGILAACIGYIEATLITESRQPEWRELESLADVIASVDYYLEIMSIVQENNLSILDKAEKGLGLLGVAEAVETELSATATKASETTETATAATTATGDSDIDSEDRVYPEINEIFVEEFYEINQTLKEYFPRWGNNFDD